MKTLRAHGFNQRPRFEQVVGYLERNEPLPLDQPDHKATSFVTSHFYLDDFAQSSRGTRFVEDDLAGRHAGQQRAGAALHHGPSAQHCRRRAGGSGPHRRRAAGLAAAQALSLEGVSQMVYILPERLLALVRPAFDLVLRRIRSLKRCVQA